MRDPFKSRADVMRAVQKRQKAFEATAPVLFTLESKLISQTQALRKQGLDLSRLIELLAWKGLKDNARKPVLVNPPSKILKASLDAFAIDYGDDRALMTAFKKLADNCAGWIGLKMSFTSVVFHFSGPVDDRRKVDQCCPIWDRRAREAVGIKVSAQRFDLWLAYVAHCRVLAKKYDVDMRTLDIALWQVEAV